ncbi:MAG: phenylalanine 4-monooxygenase [Thermonemataceae bacterium]|nr:phenylalanine 4-monooxygenase [Thermonemataceae bacterium]
MGNFHYLLNSMQQEYDKYTDEDFEVWKILFERQIKSLPNKVTEEFLKGIERLGFEANRIPNFEEVNKKLIAHTGWRIYVVPGLLPNKEFFELMEGGNFCATTWLRKKSQLDYLEEPDMFHDVFGHVPLLTNQALCNFLKDLSTIALRHIESEVAIELIARLYWYTVEFGLIQEAEGLRIYGAGILSSSGETDYSLFSEVPERVPFDVQNILDTPYIKDKYQRKYFVINSFEQLYASIPEVEKLVAQAVAENKVLAY